MNIVPIMNMASTPTGLPIVQNFFVPVGATAQLLMVSATAYGGVAGMLLELEVLVGATVVGTPLVWASESGSHKTFPTSFINLTLAPNATYTLTIREKDGSGTATNSGDYFSACLLVSP